MFKNRSTAIILFFCIVKLALHLIADAHSGFQGDELLHIETGNYPAMGYMEFPPLIGMFAFIQNLFQSQSVFVHHLFTHLASLLIMIIVARITMLLGGRAKAIFLVLLCILIAPAFGRSQQLFQPVVFSQLFWVLSFYQLARFVQLPRYKYLLYLTIAVAVGFMAKYDMLFFIAGLSSLLCFKPTRQFIFKPFLLYHCLLFLAIVAPNLYWQFQHGFPVLQMFSRLYETQLNHVSGTSIFIDLLISLNPLTALFWVGGFIYMFSGRNKELYRPLALSVLITVFLLAVSKGKAYYYYPVILCVLPFGAIWFEQKVLAFRRWIIYPVSMLMLTAGFIMVPFGLAMMPLQSFIKFAHLKKESGHYEVEYKEYYAKEKWHNTLTQLKEVYDSLPAIEKQDGMIWGKHYSQAGAVNLLRNSYNLPAAFSFHGSFYLWAPSGKIPKTVLGFTNGEAGIDFFQSFFYTVIPVRRIYNPYADFDKDLWQTIYICKNPKQDFEELKLVFKNRVFE